MTTDLHPCPKCQTPMRTIERSGIHIETCPDCRGIFLDRGELDRLLDLEAATLVRRDPASAASMGGAAAATASLPPVPPVPPYPASPDAARQRPPADWDRRRQDWDDDDDDDDRYERRGWDRERDGRGRRRGGFLGELLEGFGD
jgi:hypothetical protein